MPSAAEVDQAIMLAAKDRWLKVARIVAEVGHSDAEGSTEYAFIADRIAALVKAGELEAQGNLSNWRHSEVRLPAKS